MSDQVVVLSVVPPLLLIGGIVVYRIVVRSRCMVDIQAQGDLQEQDHHVCDIGS